MDDDLIMCRGCKKYKPTTDFTKSNKRYCKICVSEKNRRYHLENKERINEHKKSYMTNVFNITHPTYKKDYYENHKFDISNSRKENNLYLKEKRHDYYERNRDRIIEDTTERGKKYRNIQLRTRRRINKLGIRPSTCPICGYNSMIIAHHPDYSKRYKIVFCCKSCHSFIHNGTIMCPEPIDILDYNNYNG